jgi:HSP20 family molecular chaperone IbpA
MAELKVQKGERSDERLLPVFREAEQVLERIRKRAFELFSRRGGELGHELEDWLAAEREICWPKCELEEHEGRYQLSMALPGFDVPEIAVTATPGEIIVHAATSKTSASEKRPGERGRSVRWSQFESNDVYRRIELEKSIDLATVSATLHNGLLKISAAQSVQSQSVQREKETSRKVVPVSAAA